MSCAGAAGAEERAEKEIEDRVRGQGEEPGGEAGVVGGAEAELLGKPEAGRLEEEVGALQVAEEALPGVMLVQGEKDEVG